MTTTTRTLAFPPPGDLWRQPELMIQWAQPHALPAANFAGCWINDPGSVLELTCDGNAVSGRITPRPGLAQGGEATGTVIGAAWGSSIAFISHWGGRAGLATWIGEFHASEGKEMIMLSWELLRYLDDPQRPVDMTMGSAKFIRLPPHGTGVKG